MMTVKAGRIKSYVILSALIVGFIGMFIALGPAIYNDSDQYIKMHIHREPLYPLFLWILRTVFGEVWPGVTGIVQNVFTAVSIWLFAEYICRKFSLYLWEEILVVVLELMPYIVTTYFSALKIFIPNAVMSEALCLPLFTLFIVQCFEMFTAKRREFRRPAVLSLILALLLSLTRSQMLFSIPVWLVVMGIRTIRNKEKRRKKLLWLCCIVIAAILTFSLRMLAVKSYNLVFNGRFINNTYGAVNTLTNILYASDREDGENIKDDEAREFFYLMYDTADAQHANYKYAGDALNERAGHIEQWHDIIKCEIIEDLFYQTYKRTIVDDYIIINLRADETSMKIIMGILPKCFGRWFSDYLMLACYGMIRSIAVAHPVINYIALLFYLLSAMMAILTVIRNRKEGIETDNAVWFYLLSMLVVLANVFTVAITIMTLSRYMIYGFSSFYTGCFLLIITNIRAVNRQRRKR